MLWQLWIDYKFWFDNAFLDGEFLDDNAGIKEYLLRDIRDYLNAGGQQGVNGW